MKKPNVIFVFGDQWRAQAMGYAGNSIVKTPNFDSFADESIDFVNAVAGCPVCSPYRASLLTGQYPLTHGVFLNDVYLSDKAVSIAQAFKNNGYDTAYIGKWHVDGHGRTNYIPEERHQGFDYWKVLECTHDYNHSIYYEGNCSEEKVWDGYDAIAQTEDACNYLKNHPQDKPFFMVLSWGPPHAPYETAPEEFRALYTPDIVELRPNVPETHHEQSKECIAGYYAHCTALDHCFGKILNVLKSNGMEKDTLIVFTSDHGDMLGSQGQTKKQRPWEESICVPFLLRYPALLGDESRKLDSPIDAPDIMPTLLGLCDIPIPDTVEGLDFSGYIKGGEDPSDGAALLMCPQPFGQWTKKYYNGREYRGLRTRRYTYVRDLNAPWILYDNLNDPYQLDNLIDNSDHQETIHQLETQLQEKLKQRNDDFLPGEKYIEQWNYPVDDTGTIPIELKK